MKTGDRETGKDNNSKFWARDNENLSQNSGSRVGDKRRHLRDIGV